MGGYVETLDGSFGGTTLSRDKRAKTQPSPYAHHLLKDLSR
jgi:hypothetical protein